MKTKTKILVAKFLSLIVIKCRFFSKTPTKVSMIRSNITWDLDLTEGIDLSIYLFGKFERPTWILYKSLIHPGDVILDIGANIGAHTLPMAMNTGPSGKVWAFEPTRYAYSKLIKNIALNPNLEPIIEPSQVMLNREDSATMPPGIYSSWPLIGDNDELDDIHKGKIMDTIGASAMTLDSFIQKHNIQKVDLVKLDVDGNELDVLIGSKNTILRYHPTIIMEIAPYLFPNTFSELILFIKEMSYTMTDMYGSNLPLDPSTLIDTIKFGSSVNVVLFYKLSNFEPEFPCIM